MLERALLECCSLCRYEDNFLKGSQSIYEVYPSYRLIPLIYEISGNLALADGFIILYYCINSKMVKPNPIELAENDPYTL
jgi:hypothetical protein